MISLVPRGMPSRLLCVTLLSHVAAAELDCATITRGNLVACAQANSPLLAAELASSRAAEGRKEAARPFLPTNPVVSGSLASRTGADARATNWSVTLAQELELAGQSGVRVASADQELEAQRQQVEVAKAAIAEQVWLAWFEALAAKERAELAVRIEQATQLVATTVQGMTSHGLASPIDAAVADAASVRASRARLEAARDASSGEVRLRSLLGAPSRLEVAGPLEPLRSIDDVATERPEVRTLESQKQASAGRLEVLRRSRVPNATVSLFAQNDGFDERVFGVGLGIPIPLPQPLGRTRAGEVAEAIGVQARLDHELTQLNRTLTSDRELAKAAWESAAQTRALYSGERLERARQGLTAISEQLAAARVPVRDALHYQQVLVELLQADVDARYALCVASVRLVRARGGSLEGGAL
ncbi:MAG: TolC family protein [Archangium sp.]|nr:TolC family protein [Archangium sp.]MDP3573027.1 TolC family protein [Archangium sp.]